jgi:hypothetical protein
MAKHTAERLPRVAYLTGNYPAVSHTFILREIAMLRRLGFTVAACSIRQTPPAQLLGPEERAEAEQTFNVLNAARRPATLVAAQGAALRRPGRYLRALRLALTDRRPGLKGLLWQLFYFAEATVLARHLLQNRDRPSAQPFRRQFGQCGDACRRPGGYRVFLHAARPGRDLRSGGLALREKTARARFVFCISHFARSQAMLFSDPATGRS